MRTRYLALFAVLSMATFFSTACGGDDGGPAVTATTAPTRTAEATKAATSVPTAAATSRIGSGVDELRKLAKDLSKKTYQVTYEFTTATGSGTMLLAQAPPKSVSKLDSAAESLTLIDDGRISLLCTKKAVEVQGSCLQTASSGASATTAAFSLDRALDDLEANANAALDKDDTIAGRAATCFIVKTAAATPARACFDKQDGIALLLQSTDKAGARLDLKAAQVSNTVDDRLFDAPYPVTP